MDIVYIEIEIAISTHP